MIKPTIFRIVNIVTVAFLLSSCASMKKNQEPTSNSVVSQSSETRTTPTSIETGKIQNVNPEQFQKLLLLDEVQLVDVRTEEEFQGGHIKGAMNIDVKNADFKSNTVKLNKDKPVLVYCRSGKRSTDAAEVLKEQGFKKIVSLDGGIISWEEADLPLNK